MSDGSLRVLDAQRRVVFHILILSVKEDFGAGTGDPAMDIGASYGWHMSQQYWQPFGSLHEDMLPSIRHGAGWEHLLVGLNGVLQLIGITSCSSRFRRLFYNLL